MNTRTIHLAACVCLLTILATARADLKSDWEAAVTAGNPLHWYKFDETGSDCLDSGSGALNGTYENVQPAQEGWLGPNSAAVYTRTGANRAVFQGATSLPGPWTVEYIVKTTKAPAGSDSQVLHDDTATSIRLAGWTSLGEVGFTAYGVADYQFTPSAGLTLNNLVIQQDQWVHLVWRNKGGTQMFINGELVGTSSSSINLPRLAIGGRGAGPADMLQGVLDEAIVYNRALTDQDIINHAKVAGLAPVQARNPNPADGATGVSAPFFQWTAGIGARFHDFYLGTSPDLTSDNLVGRLFVPLEYYMGTLEPGGVYYWKVDEVEADNTTVHPGNVWHFTVTPLNAYNPLPRDGDKWIATDATLTWMPGNSALSHTLYFGTDQDAVANRADSVAQGKLTSAAFTPTGLAADTTYYWAVDESALNGENPGPVWSFTTRGATVTGGIKGEYFVGMTLSGAPALTRLDPAVDFAWAADGPGAPIPIDGFSVRWTADLEIAVADTYTFTTNSDDGARLWVNDQQVVNRWVDQGATDAVSQPIPLEPGIYPLRMEYYENTGDATAHLYWQTPTLEREIIPAGPLQPPVRARTPYPAKGDVNVPQDVSLRWSAGDEAAQHQVYFGDDAAAVAAADTSSSLYKGTQALDNTSFTPGTLEWNKTYWWRVDEVNDASADSPWVGPVWSFTTADYLVVDDFESYNDEEDKGTRIYETWIDGYTDGLSGSIVGNLDPPFAEQTIVHSGKQAMPMDYNNVNSPYFSEAYRQLAPLQDWTANGVTDLSLWLRGQPIRFQQLADDHIVMSSTSGDVWDVVDHFRYVFKKLTGDGTIIAKVESMTNTAGWAKAGVMIRDSLEPGSMHALEMLAPGGLCAFQNRQFNDGPSFTANGNNGQFTFPHWVKLERKGNQFTAYHSTDGVNWTLQADEAGGGGPNPQTITMSSTVYIGLMVTSNNMNRACVAEFSNIKLTGTVSGAWQAADVGPAIVGNDAAPLYLAVEDSAGQKVTIVHPDPAAVNISAWTEWKIPLTDLAGVNLGKVKKLYIGVGDKANPTPDGYGRIYIDDIRVTKP
jgi:hypothetical protein